MGKIQSTGDLNIDIPQVEVLGWINQLLGKDRRLMIQILTYPEFRLVRDIKVRLVD